MATELLEWQNSSRVTSHPSHLLLAARAAAQWAKQLSESSGNPELGCKLQYEANCYFEQAREHCAFFPSSEEIYNSLCALTAYTVYLSEQEPDREEDIDRFLEQTFTLLHQELSNGIKPKGIKGPWFELITDREFNHVHASRLYGLGIEIAPEWVQLWIKGLGAASLAGVSEQVNWIKNALSADKVVDLLTVSTGAYKRQRKELLQHVVLRWEEALRLVGIFWGSDSRVQNALERLRRIGG